MLSGKKDERASLILNQFYTDIEAFDFLWIKMLFSPHDIQSAANTWWKNCCLSAVAAWMFELRWSDGCKIKKSLQANQPRCSIHFILLVLFPHFLLQAGSKFIKNVPVVKELAYSSELVGKDRFSEHVRIFFCSELSSSKNCKKNNIYLGGNVQTFQTPSSN